MNIFTYNLRKITKYLLIIFVFLHIFHVSAQEKTFYCSKSKFTNINNEKSGTIITKYEGESEVPKGVFCSWRIIGSSNSLIKLYIKSIGLGFSPRKGCEPQLDSLTISDLVYGSKKILGTFCKGSNPKYVLSYSNEIIIELETKVGRAVDNLDGAVVEFQEISKSEPCLPDWMNINDNCYYIPKNRDPDAYTDAQKFCSYNKANLVKFDTLQEWTTIKKILLNDSEIYNKLYEMNKGSYRNKAIKYWIALNDLSNAGRLEWLDQTLSTFYDGNSSKEKSYNRCISIVLKRPFRTLKSIYWERQFCDFVSNPDKALPLCKRVTLNKTQEIWNIPQLKDERTNPSETFKWWIILLVVGAIILICIILAVFFIKYNRSKESPTVSRNSADSLSLRARPSPPPSYREATRK